VQVQQLNVADSASPTPTTALAKGPIEVMPRLDPDAFPHAPQGWQRVLPSTLPNVAHLLKSYGIGVRYDTVKKKLRIAIPGHTGTTDNADNTAMTIILSLAALHGMALGQIPALVEAIGDRHLQNPVEPARVSWRPVGLSQAATASCSARCR
jgi:hypothetical protein